MTSKAVDHVEELHGLLAAGGADPFSESERRALQAAITALSAKPQAVVSGAKILDVGFKVNGPESWTPTVLVGFNENNWASRDKFAAFVASRSSEK